MNSDASVAELAPELVGKVDRFVGQLLGIGEQRRAGGRIASSPSMRSAVMIGRWFTPTTSKSKLAEVGVEELRERELRARDLVAQPDGLDRRLARHRAAQAWSSGS